MLAITDGKGFHIQFKNGWNVSVQFGPKNYCTNSKTRPDNGNRIADDAEIAAWCATKETKHWLSFTNGAAGMGSEDVKGYVYPEDVAYFISFVSNLPVVPYVSAISESKKLAKEASEDWIRLTTPPEPKHITNEIVTNEIVISLRKQDVIGAIRAHRTHYQSSLKDAKLAVEQIGRAYELFNGRWIWSKRV